MAGGVDLILKLRRRLVSADRIVSLKKIPGLNYVTTDDEGYLHVGALATMQQVADHDQVRESWTALAEGNAAVGSLQTKRMSTVVGNLCVSTPVSDVTPALFVLGGKFIIVGRDAERIVDAEDFFTGLGTTVLQPGEIVREITLTPTPDNTTSLLLKAAKTHDDISKVCVGIAVTVNEGLFLDVKIALGAVAVTTVRALEAETFLRGKAWSDDIIAEAGAIAAANIDPISDVRSTAAYRAQLVKVMVRDGLKESVRRLTESEAG